MNIDFRDIVYKTHCRVSSKALSTNLYYVVIFWVSPFNTIEKRIGYFEDTAEAVSFAEMLKSKYDSLEMPYVIYSDCNTTIDGNLFKTI